MRNTRQPRPRRREYPGRKRSCRFCAHPGAEVIDYKNLGLLIGYIDDRARIRKARRAGVCRLHQSQIAQAIKRAREIALLPYTQN